MTDQHEDDGATLGDVFDAVIGGMTAEQFEALAQRTGHRQIPADQRAKEALAQLLAQDNLAADRRTVGEVRDRLARRRNP